MKQFRKPDLNAPRYRAQRLNILNKEFYDAFREAHPKYSYLSDKDIKNIVMDVNGKIWQTVIDERDGVELPEQLGYIFIGSCPPPKKTNTNYYISKQLEKEIQHRNWESDQYLAKIVYTNSATKYRFQFSNLWGLAPVRQFSRTVAKTYPENYTKYIIVNDYKQINNLFRILNNKIKTIKTQEEILKDYDEFDLE